MKFLIPFALILSHFSLGESTGEQSKRNLRGLVSKEVENEVERPPGFLEYYLNGIGDAPCVPATSTFTGVSVTTLYGKDYAFETCYKLDLGDEAKYCWSKSYQAVGNYFYQCIPNQKNGECASLRSFGRTIITIHIRLCTIGFS